MKNVLKRLSYGLIFALPLMAVTLALVHARGLAQSSDQPSTLNCLACHEATQKAWEAGAHAKGTNDPVFKDAWEKQGKPGDCLTCHVTGYDPQTKTFKADGITCEACHGTPNPNHPTEPMAADRSPQACGACHTETLFEWQASQHRANNVDCVSCHDVHGNTLKAADSGQLCASCHRDRASNFNHSAHSEKGMTCADCHLSKLEGDGQGHARLDHSFKVSLTTCNRCHSYQMHDPSAVHPDNPTPVPPDSLSSVEALSVTETPHPVNPFGVTTLVGLIGLAVGIVLAPWLERWNRRK